MSYQDTIIASGPTYYWRLDEASGNLICKITSSPLSAIGTWTRRVEGAIITDTVSNYAMRSAATGNNYLSKSSVSYKLSKFTYEFWFIHPSSAVGSDLWLFYHGGVQVKCRSGGVDWLTAATPVSSITSGTAHQLDVWNHVVFAKDAGVAKLYLNGQLVGSIADTDGTVSYGNLEFARYPYGGSTGYFRGVSLDEIAYYYDKALTSSQVEEHYFAGRPPPQPEVVVGSLSSAWNIHLGCTVRAKYSLTDWYPIQTLAAGYGLMVSQSRIAASDLLVSQDVSTLYNSAVTQEITAPYPLMVARGIASVFHLGLESVYQELSAAYLVAAGQDLTFQHDVLVGQTLAAKHRIDPYLAAASLTAPSRMAVGRTAKAPYLLDAAIAVQQALCRYQVTVEDAVSAPSQTLVAQDLIPTYALSIATDFPAYYRVAEIVSQAFEGLWGITCASESIAGFYVPVCAELHCPSMREINSLVLAWWGEQSDVSRQIVAPYAYIVGEVGAELSARYNMLAYNPVSSAITGYWNILQDTGSQFRPLDFSVVHKGVPL
ncbi:MAG: LamG domain-containing protein [Magnetococcus sp. THC-1_WYH]